MSNISELETIEGIASQVQQARTSHLINGWETDAVYECLFRLSGQPKDCIGIALDFARNVALRTHLKTFFLVMNDFKKQKLEEEKKQQLLFDAIKKRQPEFQVWLDKQMKWTYEDGIYRFYHYSFKVYKLQDETLKVVEMLREIANEIDGKLNIWFEEIVFQGTGKEFELEHNHNWAMHTRPIVEAYLHAKYFAEMAIKSAHEMRSASDSVFISSGWASILILYKLR